MILHPHVQGMKQSATLWINHQSRLLQEAGKPVFRWGLGQSPFPVPDRIVGALKSRAHEKDYLPVEGCRALREAVASYNHRKLGLNTEAEDVLIGPGSKELMFLLQLVFGGELVIPSPSWVSYAPQAAMLGRPTHWIPTREENGWRLTPDELEAWCATQPPGQRLLILNYPNNPTGCSYTPEALEALAQVARKHQLLVLSDEIYGELHFEGAHVSMARYYPEGTVVSSGLSKWCGAGGWRLGTFSFAPELAWLKEAVAAAASETFTSTSAPIQYAAIPAFQGGSDMEAYLDGSRRVLKHVVHYTLDRLAEAHVHAPAVDGAFYIFPNFEHHREALAARGIHSSPQLCQTILEETGVAFLPGTAFGRPPEELTARMSLVDFDGDMALLLAAQEEGPELGPALRDTCCARMVHGTARLVEWVEQM